MRTLVYIALFPFHEARLSYQFIWRDLSTTMISAFIFMLAAVKFQWPMLRSEVALAAVRCIIYFWLYIYLHSLASQIVGVQEDCLNKPDRPIPAGLVSRRGAALRLAVVVISFMALGTWFHILRWTICWVTLVLLYNHFNLDRHWFTKNVIFVGIGTVAQVAGTWEMVAPLTPLVLKWAVVVGTIVGFTVPIQDFRDIAGDLVKGRRTLPMILGDRAARLAVSVNQLVAPIVLYLVFASSLDPQKLLWCSAALFGMGIVIIVNLLSRRSMMADHKTYMMWTYWYCALLATGIVLL